MKLVFQVIRDGGVIFKSGAMAQEADLPLLTMNALRRFREEHPALSLTDQNIVLKWEQLKA